MYVSKGPESMQWEPLIKWGGASSPLAWAPRKASDLRGYMINRWCWLSPFSGGPRRSRVDPIYPIYKWEHAAGALWCPRFLSGPYPVDPSGPPRISEDPLLDTPGIYWGPYWRPQ